MLIYLTTLAFILFSCSADKGTGFVNDYTPGDTLSPNVAVPTLRKTLPASWDENWFSSPAVFDLDNDGKKEIIAARHSVLYVWKSTGELLWRTPVGENSSSSNNHGKSRQYASPVVGDLDGDGLGEIAIAWKDQVAVYDHMGTLQSGWPQGFPGSEGEIRSISAADLNNNGKHEILVVKTNKGPVTAVYSINGKLLDGWPQAKDCSDCNDFGGYNQNIGVADLDGNGSKEIVSTYDMTHIGIMYLTGQPFPAHPMYKKAGPWASSIPMFHDLALAQQGWGADMKDRDEFTDSPPSFGDVDGDGLPEIILYSDHERAGEYINRGNCLWILNPDMTRSEGLETPICSGPPLFTGYQNNIVQVSPSPAIASLVGDSKPEIVVPSYDGYMRCFSPTGKLLWKYRFGGSTSSFIGASEAVIADLDQNGSPEVIFTTYSIDKNISELLIFDAGGTRLHQIPIEGRGSMSAPTLADIDGDGIIEIIISLKDVLGDGKGGVQIWDVSSARTSKLLWPTGRGNYLRTGNNL